MAERPLICGFSYGKNLVDLDYPVVEAIRSVLPICDRYVFRVGKCDDGTREMIASISPKIEVVDSVWPETMTGGDFFRIEGQKAMDAAAATGAAWGLHQFCDEAYHEDDLPKLRAACEAYADDDEVKALLVRVLNFVYDYRSIDPWMYRKVCRAYKLDGSLELYGDGCGPGIRKDLLAADPSGFHAGGRNNHYLDKHHLGGHVRWAKGPGDRGRPARVFHYAWVKDPDTMRQKIDVMEDQYWGDLPKAERKKKSQQKFQRFMTKYNALRNFTDEHPGSMRDRVAAFPPLKPRRNRWLSLRFYQECAKHGVKL